MWLRAPWTKIELTSRDIRRFSLVAACLLLTLSVALYAILKSSPTATDLWLLPASWAAWLDDHYDSRTLLLTLGVLLPVAGLLGKHQWNAPRRIVLLMVTCGLVAAEFAQLAIAGRSFSWADVGYTLLGGVVAGKRSGEAC